MKHKEVYILCELKSKFAGGENATYVVSISRIMKMSNLEEVTTELRRQGPGQWSWRQFILF